MVLLEVQKLAKTDFEIFARDAAEKMRIEKLVSAFEEREKQIELQKSELEVNKEKS